MIANIPLCHCTQDKTLPLLMAVLVHCQENAMTLHACPLQHQTRNNTPERRSTVKYIFCMLFNQKNSFLQQHQQHLTLCYTMLCYAMSFFYPTNFLLYNFLEYYLFVWSNFSPYKKLIIMTSKNVITLGRQASHQAIFPSFFELLFS